MMNKKVSIFWFRRDLRLQDNVGLYYALQGKEPVLPIFIFDPEILGHLPKDDARVSFIFDSLQEIRGILLKNHQSSLAIYHGAPLDIFQKLISEYELTAVHTNHDYEPYAQERDKKISQWLASKDITFKTYKDQVIFEKSEVVKDDGEPYVVYTPYMKKWKSIFNPQNHLKEYDSYSYLNHIIKDKNLPNSTLGNLGFKTSSITVPNASLSAELISNYEKTRNFPALPHGTSRLGPHLRFGTVSVRQIIKRALEHANEVFWNELIWREFFMQILWHYPQTVNHAFKPKYDRIQWRNYEVDFERWKKGETGYPLVDAGMRELNNTGFMHNRVRMLTASFLCKHLLIDWRWGESYFAEKLLDYEMSSNVGNWQWAAGSGVDAAPYFRIFNPTTQIEKFDKQHRYIQQWVPELQELTYPQPMIEHKWARERCLAVYKEAVG